MIYQHPRYILTFVQPLPAFDGQSSIQATQIKQIHNSWYQNTLDGLEKSNQCIIEEKKESEEVKESPVMTITNTSITI